jgi:hypothetical protein
MPSLIEEIAAGHLAIPTRTAPLADVERIWAQSETPGVRTVLLP